jgi:Putative peptidoglycan binding domain
MSSKKLISVSFLAAATIAINTAPTWGQTRGGTQSERTPESGTPLPQGSQSSGTEDPSKAGRSPGSTSQSPSGTGQSNKDSSIGGSQSKRAGDSDTPVPQGRFSGQGATEKESGSANQPSGAAQRNRSKDSSIGGSQSQRSSESDVPVTKGRFGDSGTSGQSSRSVSSSGMSGQQDIRQVQEALKSQGHDPGPIDGVMGPQTRQALRAFQSSNGLKQTGMLDAETKQKLNINDSSARGTKPMGESSTRQKESSPMGK